MAQFYAMSTIRNLVDDRYRRLIVKDQPDLCALLSNHSLRSITDEANLKDKQSEDTNALSAKILNGPAISREDNESQVSQSSEVSAVFAHLAMKSSNFQNKLIWNYYNGICLFCVSTASSEE